jgi:uncharacterized membrane protein
MKKFFLENFWLIGVLIVAALLRIYHINFQSLWLDEIYTMKMSDPRVTFSNQIAAINEKEGFPYLYFLVLKTLHSIFGYTPIIARLFSAIFGILGVYMIYKFGKLLFTKNVGLIAAILTCFSEFCIFTSQDARPYSLYFFTVILSFYCLVTFLRNSTLRNAIIYGLSCGLLLNTNFFSLVNLFSHFLIILMIFLFSESSERKVIFKYSAVSAVIALLLFLPNYQILKKLMGFESGWIPAPTSDSLTLIFKEILGGSEATIFIITPLFFYYLFDVFKAKLTNERSLQIINNDKVFGFLIVGFWAVVLIGVIYLKSYADTSLMITRYFVSILPVFIIVIAVGINLITTKVVKVFVLSALCFFMFSNLVFAKRYYTSPIKTQFREASNFVKENNTTNEKVYTSLKYFFDYFFESETKFSIAEKPSLEIIFNEMQADTTKLKSFWYVEAHSRPFNLSENARAFSDEFFYIEKRYDGFDAWARHYVLKSNKLEVINYAVDDTDNSVVRGWIDQFEFKENELVLNGWAFLEGFDTKESTIEIILLKDKIATVIPTTNYARNDVTLFVNNGFNVDNSGFSVKTNVDKIDNGTYSIAVKVTNSKFKKTGIFVTDKKIDVIN